MNATPTHSLHGPSRAPRWSELTGGAALACAFSPILALFGIGPTAIITLGPMAAVALAVVTFATTRGRDARSRQAMAGAALAVVAVWILLFAMFAIEMFYG
jgi:hypothetical protein